MSQNFRVRRHQGKVLSGGPQPGTYDLVVDSISLSPSSPTNGQAVTYTAVVRNQGSIAVPSGTVIGVLFTTDDNQSAHNWSDTYTGGLTPNATVSLTANSGNSAATYTAVTGSHSVGAWVDDANRFPLESPKDNNTLSKSFSVSSGSTTRAWDITGSPANESGDRAAWASWLGSSFTGMWHDFVPWAAIDGGWLSYSLGGASGIPDGNVVFSCELYGSSDSTYVSFAQQLVAAGRSRCIIRLGWEMDGNWYPWGTGLAAATFVSQWRAAVTAMRSVPGANFKFDFCPSAGNGPLSLTTDRYPGDAYVDIIGLDFYDWYIYTSDPVARWNAIVGYPNGLQWQHDFALAHGKQISSAEWGLALASDGSGSGGGDNTYFIAQVKAWLDKCVVDGLSIAFWCYYNRYAGDGEHRLTISPSSTDHHFFPNAAVTYKSLFA